jgi:hypothetical protein
LNYIQYRNSALTNPIKDIAYKEEGNIRIDGTRKIKDQMKEAKKNLVVKSKHKPWYGEKRSQCFDRRKWLQDPKLRRFEDNIKMDLQ